MAGPLTIALAAVAGACAGSFCATVAVRAARGEQALGGRSACDACGVPLGFARTVPVLSYVQAGGACVACGGRIDRLHPTGEVCGALLVGLWFAVASPERAALLSGLALALLTASMIDIRTRRLPDVVTAAVAVFAVVLSAMRGLETLWIGLLCAGLTWAGLELIRRAYRRRGRGEGLGGGDVKLMAAIALWLGSATPWALALASALGLVGAAALRPKDGRLPFGPFIAAAALIVGFWGEALP